MKVFPIQTSFAGGEVTEKILGRTSSAIYAEGAIKMENFIADSRGPAISRPGLKAVDQLTLPDEKIRLENFQVTGDKAYVLRFTNLALDIATPDGVAPAGGASHVIPHTAAQLKALRVVFAPGGSTAYILHENVPVYKLTYTIATDTFAWAAVTFTAKPASWTGTNWPAVGAVFQGRLWLGRTPSGPETFWASVSASLEDFTGGSTASAAILGVVMEHYGAIQWMIGTKDMVIGTLTGEYIVKSDTGVIDATDIQIERQSTYGSSFADCLMIGDRIFHLSANGQKVRMMEYSFSKNNWISDEANFFADHLTRWWPFTKIIWLPNPNNLLFAINDFGDGAYFTWEAETEVHGWSPFTTFGAIRDCTASLVNGFSILTLGVLRKPQTMDIEHSILDPTSDNEYYMDSWIEGTIGGDKRTITGLNNHVGKVVQLLVDGAVHPDKTVAAPGQVVLNFDANSTVIAGLQYDKRITTLPVDTGTSEGTSKAHFKQFSRYLIHIWESAVPLINGTRAPTRYPATPMGTPEPLRTEFVEATLLGWDRQAQVEIEQDLPLPLNVLAVFGELSQENF